MLLIRRVVKVGTSLGVTLPPALRKVAGLRHGDDVLVSASAGGLLLRKVDRVELLQQVERHIAGEGHKRKAG